MSLSRKEELFRGVGEVGRSSGSGSSKGKSHRSLSRSDLYLKLVRSSVVDSGIARVFFGKPSMIPSLKSLLKEDASLKESGRKWELKLVSSVSLSSAGCKDRSLKGNGFLYVLACKRPVHEVVDSDIRRVGVIESRIVRAQSGDGKLPSGSVAGLVGVWFMDGWVSLSTWSYWKNRLLQRSSTTWMQGLQRDSYSLRSSSYSSLLMTRLLLQSSLEGK